MGATMLWSKNKKEPEQGTRAVNEMTRRCLRDGVYVPDRDGDGSREKPYSEKIESGPYDEVKTGHCYRRLQVAGLLKALYPSYSSCGR